VETHRVTVQARTAAQTEAAVVVGHPLEACHHQIIDREDKVKEMQHRGLRLSQQAKLVRTNNNGALSSSISNSSSRLDPSPLVRIRCPRARSVPLEQVRQVSKTVSNISSSSTITPDHPTRLVPRVVLGTVANQQGASLATPVEVTLTLATGETTQTQVVGQTQAEEAHLVHPEGAEGEDPQTPLTTAMRTDRVEGGDTHEGPGTVGAIVAPTQLTSLEQVMASSSKPNRVLSSSSNNMRQVECTFPLV
jgi:hypothetical protein